MSALLLRTLAVGRQQQFDSIEVALDIMEEGDLMNRFDIGRYHFACSAASLFVAIWVPGVLSSGLSP